MRGEVCAHPGLDGAVVSQDKNSTVKVILLGGEGGCVDGDVWISVREELVGQRVSVGEIGRASCRERVFRAV